jgi:hypothetical protein
VWLAAPCSRTFSFTDGAVSLGGAIVDPSPPFRLLANRANFVRGVQIPRRIWNQEQPG